MSTDIVALKRQLKIKSGAAKRLLKENGMYRKETEEMKRKLDKLIADGVSPDEWDVKNATRLCEESNKMVDDSSSRLGNAVGELRELVVQAKKEPSLSQDDDLRTAEDTLESAAT
ncbi:hypothetical protein K435DRAFT_834221 [Dendrothele bispora CBS 962.96]|uniref:Tubulin-specific chaperone A n=1 Tax=Dendrothele bispora (strain CBS 962.96) TaxID=1314807 RepID=A0A4S8MV29_DENBC|nr:hypothetical protein K435DRAFT_834221 [Dendrothele bispora CBS 962.96]